MSSSLQSHPYNSSTWMIEIIGENLLEVFNTLEFTIEEVQWVYARGFTSVYSIVDGSYPSPDSVAQWVGADELTDPTFQAMLTKIVLIGRYFLHRLLPTQHYLDCHTTTELIPTDFNEGERFIQQFFNRSSLICFVQ